MPILVMKRDFRNGTHRHTTHGHCDLETESAQWDNSVKIQHYIGITLKEFSILNVLMGGIICKRFSFLAAKAWLKLFCTDSITYDLIS